MPGNIETKLVFSNTTDYIIIFSFSGGILKKLLEINVKIHHQFRNNILRRSSKK